MAPQILQTRLPLSPFLILSFLLYSTIAQDDTSEQEVFRTVKVINNSPLPFSIVWQDGEGRNGQRLDRDFVPHTMIPLQAKVGDSFKVLELPDPETGLCRDSISRHDLKWTCSITSFTVGEGEDQEISIDKDFNAVLMDTKLRARLEAETVLEHCQELTDTKELTDCLLQATSDAFEDWTHEQEVHQQASKRVGELLEEYACHDVNHVDEFTTSPPIQEELWESHDNLHEVQILHDRLSSQIHLLKDFITTDECQAIDNYAQRKGLTPARVQQGKDGPSRYLGEERQAWEAGVPIPWHLEDHALVSLGQRIFAYTNHTLPGLNISHHGQQMLMSINYFGRGQFESHCDGLCDGSIHPGNGERVATMVMYCQVPGLGGHTHFRQSGIHVVPEQGSALFFSYVDPQTMETDIGLTQHAGCPVFEGHKQIVTQWIQLGVDEDRGKKGPESPEDSKKEEEAVADSNPQEDEDEAAAQENRENTNDAAEISEEGAGKVPQSNLEVAEENALSNALGEAANRIEEDAAAVQSTIEDWEINKHPNIEDQAEEPTVEAQTSIVDETPNSLAKGDQVGASGASREDTSQET